MLGRRWPWVLLAVVVLAAALFLLLPRGRSVEVVEVTRGPIVQSVVATGRLATPARITVSSQTTARIERVRVREGDLVDAGTSLIELRSDEAEALLASARAALEQARAQLAQLADVQRPVAEQQLLQAVAAQQLAEREVERARDLNSRGFVSQAQVDTAERTLVQTRAATRAARAQAQGVRSGGVEDDLARSRLQQAQANVDAARVRLDDLVLRAPAPARVLLRQAEPGDTAQPGRDLLVLAQQGDTRIIATVDEKNLAYVRDGLGASALADAFPGRPFPATVSYVAPSVDAQRGTVEVWLRVPDPPDFLRPDMTVSVEMLVGRSEAALRLPAEALRDDDGAGSSVLVVRDGRATRVPVVVGLRGIGVVELLEGPQPGEQVILPSSGAGEGERVRVRGAPKARGNVQLPPAMGG